MLPPKHLIHRILFVDDDEDDFLLFREAVSSINPAISVSFIGDCDKDPSKFPWLDPDLIFLDLNMPGCNGFDCLKKFKESDLKDVPVVIFTTTRNQAHIDQAYQCGATLFLSKPFSFSMLTKTVQELLELDWAEPAAITRAYCTDGQYKAFTIS